MPALPRTPFVTLMMESGSGLGLDGATLLGQDLQTFAVKLDAAGQAFHPLARNLDGTRQLVSGPPGGILVAVRLPYGLTIPQASSPEIQVRLRVSALATPGAPLALVVSAPNSQVALATRLAIGITPAAVTLETVDATPEHETVGGLTNMVTVLARTAPGAGVTGLTLQATLPQGAAFESATLLDEAGSTSFDPATDVVSGRFATVPGGAARRMVVRFHALGPATLEGDSRLSAEWMPSGQPVQHIVIEPAGAEWSVASKPVALQSTVSAVDAPAPGGALQWTLTGQVSAAGADGLQITDTLGNGQHFDAGVPARLIVTRNGSVLFNGTIPASTVARDANTGATTLAFEVSRALAAAGFTGSLAGSSFQVTFQSRIDQLFSGPLASALVGQGDHLVNAAVLHGTVLANPVSDGTTASLVLPTSSLAMSVYAVNGELVSGPVRAAIGDAVTYRVLVQLPLTTARDLELLVAGPGPLGNMTFDYYARSGVPRAGHAQYGPGGSYTATAPTVSARAADGTVTFDFGPVMPVYGNGSGSIELLYTAVLRSAVAEPGSLEGQVTLIERSTDGALSQAYAAAGLVLVEPSLRLQTASVYVSNEEAVWTGTGGPFGYSPFTGQFGGVISSDGLAAEPFNDQLMNVDAGDYVTFVVAVENTTVRAAAYGVVLQNNLPAGFRLPDEGADVCVTDGAGNLLAFTGNLFDANGGLALDWAVPMPGYAPQSGLNVVLVTFTLQAMQNMRVPEAVAQSMARIVAYRSEPGAANRAELLLPGTTAATGIVTARPSVLIALTSTSFNETPGALLAVGEDATFTVIVTLPEGELGALDISHLLPAGLEFLSATIQQVGSSLRVQSVPRFGPTSDGMGFSFGTVANIADGQVNDGDRIVFEVMARARSASDEPALVTSLISASDPNDPAERWSAIDGAEVFVLAPELTLAPVASATAQAGQAATFTLRLQNSPAAATAFNVRVANALAAGLALVPGSVVVAGVPAPASVTESSSGLTVTLERLEPDEALVITFQARTSAGAANGAVFSTVVTATSDTLPGHDAHARTDTIIASAVVKVVAPELAVALTSTASLQIGGLATYRLTATLPEGASPAVQLRSVLPPGLIYLANSARVVAVGAGLNPGLVPLNVQVSGQAVQLSFGVVNASANADRRLIVELQASVSSIANLGPALASTTFQTGYASVASSATVVVANTPPALTPLPALQVTPDNLSVLPFSALQITDPNGGQLQTVQITLSNPLNGRLTGSGTFDAARGVYSITGTPATVSAAVSGLRFVPTLHLALLGDRVLTGLTMTVQDAVGGRASAMTTVAAVTTNTAPVIAGTWAGQSATTRIAVLPLSALLLNDRDAVQVSTLSIRLSDPASGRLASASLGAYDAPMATYRMTGTLGDLQRAARELVFVPASATTARLTLTLDDGAGSIATDNSTTVQVMPSIDTARIATHYALSPTANFLTFIGGAQTLVRGEVYEGPVSWLRSQLIYDGSGTVVIVAQAPSVFIKSFSGFAAVKVTTGQNVVDAGPGSNFIIGGSGDDTFFLDASQGQVVWDTISGFSPGDAVTLFGWQSGISKFSWEDNAGAVGYTGRTMRADVRGTGQTTASLTFAATTAADTNRYSISEGRIGTVNYLSIVSQH